MATTSPRNSPIIGIDLGTTYCRIAYLNLSGEIEIIGNREGDRSTPSYVAFTEDDTIIDGKAAKEMRFQNPANVVYDTKRLIGQKYNEIFFASNVNENWPFQLQSGENENVCIEIKRNGVKRKYKPEDIYAILLKELKSIAEKRLDMEVKDAVITVPAHFNYHQRIATKKAGELAGLNIVKIINEPTAAALAYVHENKLIGFSKSVLVLDLGGGTFDVSIMTVEGKCINVKATDGDSALGGRDFDNNLTEYIATKIENQGKKTIKSDLSAMRRIQEQSEKIKIDLSSETTVYLDLPHLVDGKDVELEISRNEFEHCNSQLFKICMNTIENCLRDAKINKMEIGKILLVGGSIQIPKIQEMLTKYFIGKQLTRSINPDEVVAYGAAIQAAMYYTGDEIYVNYVINDITAFSLGISVGMNKMDVVIPRNSKVPTSTTRTFRTSVNNQPAVSILIYEGERPLIRHNTFIGRTRLKLPQKPVAYRSYITFFMNADGILEVSGKTTEDDSDCYTSLPITYEKYVIPKTSSLLKAAEISKRKDRQFCRVANAWSELCFYNEKMKSLCDYDKKGITYEEKDTIRKMCKKVTVWLAGNKVKDGHPQEEVAIAEKRSEMEKLCEPIVNPYGYYVKDMEEEFHDLLTK